MAHIPTDDSIAFENRTSHDIREKKMREMRFFGWFLGSTAFFGFVGLLLLEYVPAVCRMICGGFFVKVIDLEGSIPAGTALLAISFVVLSILSNSLNSKIIESRNLHSAAAIELMGTSLVNPKIVLSESRKKWKMILEEFKAEQSIFLVFAGTSNLLTFGVALALLFWYKVQAPTDLGFLSYLIGLMYLIGILQSATMLFRFLVYPSARPWLWKSSRREAIRKAMASWP